MPPENGSESKGIDELYYLTLLAEWQSKQENQQELNFSEEEMTQFQNAVAHFSKEGIFSKMIDGVKEKLGFKPKTSIWYDKDKDEEDTSQDEFVKFLQEIAKEKETNLQAMSGDMTGSARGYDTDTPEGVKEYFEGVSMPDKYKEGVEDVLRVAQNPFVEVHSPESLSNFFKSRGVEGSTPLMTMLNAPMTFYPGAEEELPDTIRYSIGNLGAQYHASSIAAESAHGVLERYSDVGELFLEGKAPTQELMDKIFSGEIESKRNPEVFDYIDKQKKDEIARDDDNMRNVEGYTHGYVEPFLRQHMIKLAADYMDAHGADY